MSFSVMPWMLGHFAEAYLRVYGKSGVSVIKNLYAAFEPEMQEYGIGTISELFDGDPPHKPSGAISMATAVAELLRSGERDGLFEATLASLGVEAWGKESAPGVYVRAGAVEAHGVLEAGPARAPRDVKGPQGR